MGTEDDAGRVLEYVYLNRGETLTDEKIAEASGLSVEEVRDALDELEERLLVTLGLEGYSDVQMTEEGRGKIEESGAFEEEFGNPLDLERIVQGWESAD